jgi:quercetin dioxygenase-like cupin family protein
MDKNLTKLNSYSESGILSKVIVKSEKMNITLFCMAAGTDISSHTSTRPGYVHVLEGDGLFRLVGRDIHMAPGTFIWMEANAVHSLRAAKDTSFLLVLGDK